MNLLLAVVSALFLGVLLKIDPTLMMYWPPQPGMSPRQTAAGMILLPLAAMSLYSVFINVLLMLFNLLPIPPLDGGRIMTSLLPAKSAIALSRLEPYGMFIILGLIVLDPHIHVIGTVTGTLVHVMASTIVGLGS